MSRIRRMLGQACMGSMLAGGFACGATLVGCARDPVQPMAERVIMYTCPQHPEIRSSRPETCPECGRTLIREDEVSRPSAIAAGGSGPGP